MQHTEPWCHGALERVEHASAEWLPPLIRLPPTLPMCGAIHIREPLHGGARYVIERQQVGLAMFSK